MTQEDKQLLLKDICARLPYGVKCKINREGFQDYEPQTLRAVYDSGTIYFDYGIAGKAGVIENNEVIPYLRSVSKLTPEEKSEIEEISNCRITKIVLERSNRSPYKVISEKHYLDNNFTEFDTFGDSDSVYSHVDQDRMAQVIDWFNEHHVDYRGFILKGWALEAPKDMYKV